MAFSLSFTGVASADETENTCEYDREAMLALDQQAFDQDPHGGWRVLARHPECREVAADLIRDYRQVHDNDSTTMLWHEGQMRAYADQYDQAIALFEQTRRPAEQDLFGWNPYLDATVAFLEDDYASLQDARDALSRVPYPDDEILPKDEHGNPVELDWPLNMHVVERLVACFGKRYDEAYGDCEEQQTP
ncbi:hypothetical protein CWE12_03155 [Aliidiomarina sedimenti]|uniref:Tetratricopeptide repeat-containing protein n=1 Tax=Aliidiomarina sedimenti TaxID=1933879 RepID=A0ABY0C413_9GAMM|nr:hypothetical protein CWE12_03155 [Aliidiomarina sedimenti]